MGTAAVSWNGPVSPFVGATSGGAAAVAVYQLELWVIWSSTQTDDSGATGLSSSSGSSLGSGLQWSTNIPVIDTQANRIQSAFTPSLTVFAGQMHLVVVKPDGRGTLAHYVYLDTAGAWEYNSGWAVQPLTSASPSTAYFAPTGLLYLAFVLNNVVNICTYTTSPDPELKYGTWSDPVTTRIPAIADSLGLFVSPRRTGPELHLVVSAPTNRYIGEYAMTNGPGRWSPSSPQPGGSSKRGVGACNTPDTRAILALPGNDNNAFLYYDVWNEGTDAWIGWADAPSLVVAYANPVPIVFNKVLYCFFVGASGAGFSLFYGTQQL